MPIEQRRAHFLLVEDEPAHAELVRMTLEDDDVAHTIDHVSDGAEAVAYLRREGAHADAPRPDLIVLDLKLPKLDGHEVLAAIKGDPALRPIPVVILSTSASEPDRAKAYAHHANSFLTKPVDFDKFQEMIRGLRKYWTCWNQPQHAVEPQNGPVHPARASA